ncbi:DUF1569 domain-containing protein [Paenibacillus ihbetae]|uniref:DUF1569 domain-containing protein n=1 Tax=Paenibacillus ihbetae TaxID=1870820 RepID=A0A1B2E4W6_9BACL|nr:DUF1569 domain-containing protein [Paenibacillus ihbetae]ANY75009.1 hypothetical protein BBD41_21930 [Paenibacillus ihbetae]OOC62828.1 hypothetical protein BBD40_13715 [Paenibacillus ihbetae]
MKTMYNQAHVKELMNRIENLNPSLQPKWGKMNVAQMLAHCSAFQDIAMGNSFPPRGLLGILIGRFVKPMFYNAKPPARNMSTIPSIIIADDRDFEVEKENLKAKIVQLQKDGPAKITTHPHPFFGKLTAEQWGIGLHKHLDHHLKQFGV